MVAPHVQPLEGLQLALLTAHQQKQAVQVLPSGQQLEQAAGERGQVVVQGHVADQQVQVFSLLDHPAVEVVESVDRTAQPLSVCLVLAALEVDEVQAKQLRLKDNRLCCLVLRCPEGNSVEELEGLPEVRRDSGEAESVFLLD